MNAPNHQAFEQARGAAISACQFQPSVGTEKTAATGAAVRVSAWRQFITAGEGNIPFMYLDTDQLVAVGIGNLIDPVSRALARRSVRTRRILQAAGYEPRTTVDIRADDVARVRCGTLTLLTRVKPSVSSQNQRRPAAAASGKTLAQYDPRASITSSSDLLLDFTPEGFPFS